MNDLPRTLRDYIAARTALLSALSPAPVAPDCEFFVLPAKLHLATVNLVARFASALAEKLARAEQKYGYSDGWASPDWLDECRAKLLEHVAKGDPRDVAAYCAFLWHHHEKTTPPAVKPVEVCLTDVGTPKPCPTCGGFCGDTGPTCAALRAALEEAVQLLRDEHDGEVPTRDRIRHFLNSSAINAAAREKGK